MNYFKKLFPDPPLTLFLLLPEVCLKTTINVCEVDLGSWINYFSKNLFREPPRTH